MNPLPSPTAHLAFSDLPSYSVAMSTDQIPDWLCPIDLAREKKELRALELEGVFYRALPVISGGGSLKAFLDSQTPPTAFDEFYRYIRKDPKKLKEYEEAEEIGAEYLVSEMIPIADGHPEFSSYDEDANTRKLRIDARKWKVEKWFRKKYGDKTSIDINSNSTITLQTLIDERREKVLNTLREEQLSPVAIEGVATRVD